MANLNRNIFKILTVITAATKLAQRRNSLPELISALKEEDVYDIKRKSPGCAGAQDAG